MLLSLLFTSFQFKASNGAGLSETKLSINEGLYFQFNAPKFVIPVLIGVRQSRVNLFNDK